MIKLFTNTRLLKVDPKILKEAVNIKGPHLDIYALMLLDNLIEEIENGEY